LLHGLLWAQEIIPEKWPHYSCENGKIYKILLTLRNEIPVSGYAEAVYRIDGGLCYVKSTVEDGPKDHFIGILWESQKKTSFETPIPREISFGGISKLRAAYPVVFFSVPGDSTNNLALYRYNLNSLEHASVDGIVDFEISENIAVLLLKTGRGGYYLRYDNDIIELSLQGSARLGEIRDKRVLEVYNDVDIELVDLAAKKSVYQFGRFKSYAIPDDYNVVISIVDDGGPESSDWKDEMVFYRVIIDGIESGRTDTGLSCLSRLYRGSVEPGQYHMVSLERWNLNRTKGKYERMNNISQPETKKIYFPINRIIKIDILYDRKHYHSHCSLVER